MAANKFRAPGLRNKPAKAPKPEADPERQAAFNTGLSAESRAASLLVAKGYRIVSRRWKSPVGEIDIIARQRSLLVFVEVKARVTLDDAAYSVTPRQQQRIIRAAEAYLGTYPEPANIDMRFDAVLVAPGKPPMHIEGAFET